MQTSEVLITNTYTQVSAANTGNLVFQNTGHRRLEYVWSAATPPTNAKGHIVVSDGFVVRGSDVTAHLYVRQTDGGTGGNTSARISQ